MMQLAGCSLPFLLCARHSLEDSLSRCGQGEEHPTLLQQGGGTVSIVSWAVVGGVQKVNSKTRREERETSYYCDLCGGWENGALGPEQVSSSLSLSV